MKSVGSVPLLRLLVTLFLLLVPALPATAAPIDVEFELVLSAENVTTFALGDYTGTSTIRFPGGSTVLGGTLSYGTATQLSFYLSPLGGNPSAAVTLFGGPLITIELTPAVVGDFFSNGPTLREFRATTAPATPTNASPLVFAQFRITRHNPATDTAAASGSWFRARGPARFRVTGHPTLGTTTQTIRFNGTGQEISRASVPAPPVLGYLVAGLVALAGRWGWRRTRR
jgi:hypothetical protein